MLVWQSDAGTLVADTNAVSARRSLEQRALIAVLKVRIFVSKHHTKVPTRSMYHRYATCKYRKIIRTKRTQDLLPSNCIDRR